MHKKFGLMMISLLLIGVLAACSPFSTPNNPENARSLSVNGVGHVTVVPDIASINIGVRTEAELVTDALEGNTAQANAISRALQDLGVAEEDIQTSNFNVYPSDRYDPMTGQIEGRYFVVENTVNVMVRELGNLGDVLNTVVSAGANTIYGINFSVENRDEAVAEARRLAIADAQEKASEIADAAGVQLGEIISINVHEGGYSMPYFDAGWGRAFAEAQVPIAAGTLTITMEANLSYAIE